MRKVRRRNYIPQPEPLAVRDQMRCKLEQGQLALLHSIVRGNRAAIATRSKDMAAVDHVLVHQLHITIEPCAARRLTVGHSIGQVDTMGQQMVCTKHCNRLLLGLCHLQGASGC